MSVRSSLITQKNQWLGRLTKTPQWIPWLCCHSQCSLNKHHHHSQQWVGWVVTCMLQQITAWVQSCKLYLLWNYVFYVVKSWEQSLWVVVGWRFFITSLAILEQIQDHECYCNFPSSIHGSKGKVEIQEGMSNTWSFVNQFEFYNVFVFVNFVAK
jgi:hypothetical protein